jgi:hypothetical protein
MTLHTHRKKNNSLQRTLDHHDACRTVKQSANRISPQTTIQLTPKSQQENKSSPNNHSNLKWKQFKLKASSIQMKKSSSQLTLNRKKKNFRFKITWEFIEMRIMFAITFWNWWREWGMILLFLGRCGMIRIFFDWLNCWKL